MRVLARKYKQLSNGTRQRNGSCESRNFLARDSHRHNKGALSFARFGGGFTQGWIYCLPREIASILCLLTLCSLSVTRDDNRACTEHFYRACRERCFELVVARDTLKYEVEVDMIFGVYFGVER